MSTRHQAKLLVLTIVLLVCGCAHRQMTKQSALQTANHAFEAAGHSLPDYKRPTVYFDLVCSPTPMGCHVCAALVRLQSGLLGAGRRQDWGHDHFAMQVT